MQMFSMYGSGSGANTQAVLTLTSRPPLPIALSRQRGKSAFKRDSVPPFVPSAGMKRVDGVSLQINECAPVYFVVGDAGNEEVRRPSHPPPRRCGILSVPGVQELHRQAPVLLRGL